MRYLTNDLDANGVPTFAESDATFRDWTVRQHWTTEHDGDADVRVVTTPHGTFRALVELDRYPDAPEDECGYPVYRVDSRRNYYGRTRLADEPELGQDSANHDGLGAYGLPAIVDKFAHDLEVTDRYLRIFHGGSLKVLTSTMYQGGDDFVTYDTRAMRAHWGQTGDLLETSAPEAEEWQAYLDGEVYIVSVEKANYELGEDDPTWETVDGPICGFYGDYAYQAAEDELHATIAHVAGQMLPLGGE